MQTKTDGIGVGDSNGWSQGPSTAATTTRATRLLMMMMRCEETPRQLPRASFSSTASSLLCLSLSASSRFVIIVLCGFLVASELLPSVCVPLFFFSLSLSRRDSSNVVDRSSFRSLRSLRDGSSALNVSCRAEVATREKKCEISDLPKDFSNIL